MEEAAAARNLKLDPNFLAVAVGKDGDIVSLGLGSLKEFDEKSLAKGANILFLHFKAPTEAGWIPTGFYMVHVQQNEKGQWSGKLIGEQSSLAVPVVALDLKLGIIGINAEWDDRCASAGLRTQSHQVNIFICQQQKK